MGSISPSAGGIAGAPEKIEQAFTRTDPPVCSGGVCINQGTGEATAVRVDTGNTVGDAIQNSLAPMRAGASNAARWVGQMWAEATAFSLLEAATATKGD